MDDQTTSMPDNLQGLGLPDPNAFSGSDLPAVPDAEEMKRIYGLIDRLDDGNQIRHISQDLLNRNIRELNSLTPVIQPLVRPNRSRWRERQLAAWILGTARLDPQQRQFAIESLVKLLEGKLDPDFSSVVRSAIKRTLITAVLLVLPIRQIASNQYEPDPIVEVFMSILLGAAPIMLLGSVINNRITSKHIAAEAARSLGNLRATEALDILVTAALTGRRRRIRRNRRVRQAALHALPAVLETITEAYYGHIRSETMQGLARLLQTGDESLAIAVLYAFAQVGDSMVLGAVEKLAAGGGRAAVEPRVHNAALAALPLIQVRVARARDPHQLLRGASMPPTPTDQLLRPSIETSVTDPLELLRASTAPGWKGTEEEVALVVRILNHLQQSGDTRALIYVEQIADGETVDTRIRNAATECLPVLRAHRELERYSPRTTEAQPDVLRLRQN